MKPDAKYIMGMLCMGVLMGSVCAESIMVSRDLPETANPSSEVAINLKMDVTGGGISGVIITEKIPEGWSASSVSDEGSFDSETMEIRWLLQGENVETQTLSYVAAAPSEAGEYTFSGTYTSLEEGVSEITGDERISIETKKPVEEGYDMRLIIGIIAIVIIVAMIFIWAKRKRE